MAMRDDQALIVRRGDYRAPAHLLDRVDLVFDLDPTRTTVTSTLAVRANPDCHEPEAADILWLDGEELELVSIALDGRALGGADFELRDGGLAIPMSAASATVKIVNRISPAANTELMGLYVSNGNFFTQCEAEGFRRIAYFPDRPDVMTRFRVTLRASRASAPVLLANGNLLEYGELADDRHFAVWEDPFAKPSYLFALVAGNFVVNEETIRRASGREALLQVWVEAGNLDKTAHAMQSLKRAIAWDEQRYGLELDLDRYMIVASNDFNLAAMENKGLNVFNAKYVLANPSVATDADYAAIEAIIGHEYFHNWTGNRVTCRDWFQLSLKEGLTVFREQEFSADMQGAASNRAVKRIEDVRALRALQFPEDAGPMAHPVRPDSYQEISNFYTATVYEKGAEVVRMQQEMVGIEGFRRGMDLYFKRHDGQAVTCDDFVAAIADANQRDLAQFKLWYSQAGTPRVKVAGMYDTARRTFELSFSQTVPATPGQPEKKAVVIPLKLGLVASNGSDLPLQLDGETAHGATTRTVELVRDRQSVRFINVAERPVPSLLREFSAPVIVEYAYSDAELALLCEHDSDPFNRWDAGQRLATGRLSRITDAIESGREPMLDERLVHVFRTTLLDPQLSPAFKEQALQLPSESYVGQQRAVIDPEAIRSARRFMQGELGRRLATEWWSAYEGNQTDGEYAPDPAAAGRRALRNLALEYLTHGGAQGALECVARQLDAATNMTERQGALSIIVSSNAPFKADVLVRLAREWRQEPLLMNKWFQLQATAMAQPGEPPVVDRVRLLLQHPAFSIANPNNVYALIRSFCAVNEAEFHRRDADGYAFWTEQVLTLDRINPTIAARIARALDRWRSFTAAHRTGMRAALDEVAAASHLSRDVREIVTKALAG